MGPTSSSSEESSSSPACSCVANLLEGGGIVDVDGLCGLALLVAKVADETARTPDVVGFSTHSSSSASGGVLGGRRSGLFVRVLLRCISRLRCLSRPLLLLRLVRVRFSRSSSESSPSLYRRDRDRGLRLSRSLGRSRSFSFSLRAFFRSLRRRRRSSSESVSESSESWRRL